ncbi:hypothetical protein [Methylocucumis oryzae]|uniref:hypothetical protein n=1 Tax=Methylocucumis oryzae TaxID=1632867 RepID=UPI000A98F488|nr:hypothetical protein [Methylocucumis oryzae]
MVDTQNLREERQDLPDPIYFQIHTKFLTSLLARERIFQTDSFYQRYETIAKQNISRLLEKRKSEGYG